MDDLELALDEAIKTGNELFLSAEAFAHVLSICENTFNFEADHQKFALKYIRRLTEARDTLNRIIDGAKK